MTETRTVRYWVHSRGGDGLLCVPDYAEALEYARAGIGRTLSVVVETFSRSGLPIDGASPRSLAVSQEDQS